MKTNMVIIGLLLSVRLFAGLGDINGNGTVNLDDCKLLAAKIAASEAVDSAVADIDGNGVVTIVDAMRLHQSMGGLWIEPTGKLPAVPQVSIEERTFLSQYEEVCDRFEAMTPVSFLDHFAPAPGYTSALTPQQCDYFTTIDTAFDLTEEQKAALKERGMVILDRPSVYGSGLGGHYAEIFKKDLPVFFTSDALLDPLYRISDDVLRKFEEAYMAPALSTILDAAVAGLDNYSQRPGDSWVESRADVATFFAVARALLNGEVAVAGDTKANGILKLIGEEKLAWIDDLFGTGVTIDFSQFRTRGHYECMEGEEDCPLSRYFKCMMWLGRADCAFVIDSLRQLRDFALIHACMDDAGVLDDLSKINRIVSFFVGDVDGFSLEGLSEIQESAPIPIDSIMLSDAAAYRLQTAIEKTGGANQLILSQAIWKFPDAARPELPKIAQISGQRFILDSYMLGRTVEGYVKLRNKPLLEEIPFCLGNNAATDIIAADITTYTVSQGDYKPYHARLGAARTLFEKYPYWDRNCYTLWLDALRHLSQTLPETTPAVMRSRTWQDKQMNTQLASWAQLRHNTLLYAKQSYTMGIICFYPDGYVEPYPEFYRTVGEIVTRMDALSRELGVSLSTTMDPEAWRMVVDSLASMAETELQGKPLTMEHIAFLNKMIVDNPDNMCGAPPFTGWYARLFGDGWDEAKNSRPCIADVHTIPPSEYSPSDMVLHAATGDASFVIIQAATSNECGTLYAGAISSFYQHDESPVKRLADSEWTTMLSASPKPGVPEWFGKYFR